MIRTVFLLALTVIVAGPNSRAQERRLGKAMPNAGVINDVDESTVALHPVTPFMEYASAVLIDIDLTKVDVDAMLKWIQQAFEVDEMPADATAMAGAANGFIRSLKDAGAEHLYVCASTRSVFDRGPIVIIPCKNTTVVNGLAAMAVQNSPPNLELKAHVGEDLVLLGPAATVDRVVKNDGMIRPDLILPTRGAGRLDHTMVISLPDEARQDLESLWPDQLPSEVPVQFSPRQLAKDVKRLVVSWRLPPKPEIDVQIECTDERAAMRVSEIIDKATALSDQLTGLVQVRVDESRVGLTADPQAFAKLLDTVTKPTRRQAEQMAKMNHLKMLGLAIHNYHSIEKNLPPRYFVDRQGKPLLSWRVALLPYLEQLALYQSIKLDQPFDSEANQAFAKMRIPFFGNEAAEPNQTTFRAPVFPGSMWHGEGPPKQIRDVTDGTSNTIALIDAPVGDAVAWADPQPWVIDEQDPLSDVFGDRDLITVLLLDGSVHAFTREELDEGRLQALLTIAGREVIEW